MKTSTEKPAKTTKQKSPKEQLNDFLKKDFDDMIKFANWRKGKELKELIKKCIK